MASDDSSTVVETPSEEPRKDYRPDPESDTHGHVRFFKMLEVAYNCARNGHYERARNMAREASAHYEEVNLDGE